MEEYILQLIELFEKSKQENSTLQFTNIDSELDEDEENNLFANQFLQGRPEPLSKIIGIAKYQMPPVEKLTEVQIDKLLEEVEDLFESYHFEFIFPEDVSNTMRYEFIIDNWDSAHVFSQHGMVQIETCKFNDDDCPFPGSCNICESFERQLGVDGSSGYTDDVITLSPEEEEKYREDVDRCKRMIRDTNAKKYIEGIHNYCDGRCDRCAFTDKCSSYAINLGMEDVSKKKGASDQDQMKVMMIATAEILEEELEKRGVDMEEVLTSIKHDDSPKDIEQHEVELMAISYAEKVRHWIESNQMEIESRIVVEEECVVGECISTITWFQLFIPSKIERAVMVIHDEKPSKVLVKDSNGSAKIALLAIDESVQAWNCLLDILPHKEDGILSVLKHLVNMRTQVEKVFPEARMFKRPGLDA